MTLLDHYKEERKEGYEEGRKDGFEEGRKEERRPADLAEACVRELEEKLTFAGSDNKII